MGAMQDANIWTQARGAWQERDVSIGEPRLIGGAQEREDEDFLRFVAKSTIEYNRRAPTADPVALLQQAARGRKEALELACLQCMDGCLHLLKEEVSKNPPQHASKSKGSKAGATKKGGVAHQLPTINEEEAT